MKPTIVGGAGSDGCDGSGTDETNETAPRRR
jgi:hypothetical protein